MASHERVRRGETRGSLRDLFQIAPRERAQIVLGVLPDLSDFGRLAGSAAKENREHQKGCGREMR